jgi:hypothetical protein
MTTPRREYSSLCWRSLSALRRRLLTEVSDRCDLVDTCYTQLQWQQLCVAVLLHAAVE